MIAPIGVVNLKRRRNKMSKRDNYHLLHRIEDLRNVKDTQCSKGNYDYDEYMRGMANGLLLAWNILMEPYDTDVKFKEKEKQNEGK